MLDSSGKLTIPFHSSIAVSGCLQIKAEISQASSRVLTVLDGTMQVDESVLHWLFGDQPI